MIIEIAYKTRRLKFWDSARADGHCHTLSKILTASYRDNGYPARFIQGAFYPEILGYEGDGYYHCWVDLYGFIIDVTGNQFDDIEEDVLIAPYEMYPQYYASILVIHNDHIQPESIGMPRTKKVAWTEPRKGKSRYELRCEFEKELHAKHAMLGKIPSNVEPTTGHPKTDARLIRKFGEFRPVAIPEKPTYTPSIITIVPSEIPYVPQLLPLRQTNKGPVLD